MTQGGIKIFKEARAPLLSASMFVSAFSEHGRINITSFAHILTISNKKAETEKERKRKTKKIEEIIFNMQLIKVIIILLF